VPIPLAEYVCKHGCCCRTYVPLTLAYARTIHKFQGLTAGPVDEGKIKNMYDVIVCDPDEKRFEGSSLGLLYTAVSRATTLGDEDGLNSAIYFTGKDFKGRRIRQLGLKKGSSDEYDLVIFRRRWVAHIKANTINDDHYVNANLAKAKATLAWAADYRIGPDGLSNAIKKYTTQLSRQRQRRYVFQSA